jgi:hypothetical protein
VPPYRDHPPRAQVIDFDALPARAETKVAGLLLAVPELVALDLPGLVATAGYPGTSVIPPVSYLLSLLALELPVGRLWQAERAGGESYLMVDQVHSRGSTQVAVDI